MTTYRNEEQEKRINDIYQKIYDSDMKGNDKRKIVDEWVGNVDKAYKRVFESEKGAEKMFDAMEKKSGKKYSPEEREKLKKKFMANMKK